jgi:hypothetical protein
VIKEIMEHADDESKNSIKEMLCGIKSKIQAQKHAGAKVLMKNL